MGIQHKRALLDATYIVGGTADTTVETVFHTSGGTTTSGGYILLPAGTIRPGDLWLCYAVLDVTAEHSTDTLDLAAYIGPTASPTTGIKVADYAALDAATTCKAIQFFLGCEADGTVSVARFGSGGVSYNTAATALSQTYVQSGTDAQVSTLVDLVLALTATWSVSDVGNIVRLRLFHAIKFADAPSL